METKKKNQVAMLHQIVDGSGCHLKNLLVILKRFIVSAYLFLV